MGLGNHPGKSYVGLEVQNWQKFLKTVKGCLKWKRFFKLNLDHLVAC